VIEKYLSIIIISLIGITNTSAQNTSYLISLDSVNSPPILTNFICSKVIDRRMCRANIGYASRLVKSASQAVNLKGGFVNAIEECLGKILSPAENAPTELIIAINDLTTSDRAPSNGVCVVEIEFIKEAGNKDCSLALCECLAN